MGVVTTPSHGQGRPAARGDPGARIERLQQQVSEQASQIEALKQAVAEQDVRQRELQRILEQQPQPVAVVPPPAAVPDSPDTSQRGVRVGVAPARARAAA